MAGRDFKHLYNSAEWQSLRMQVFIRDMFICQMCGQPTYRVANSKQACNRKRSPVADHIKPHKGNVELFFDPNNIQTLHKYCHDKHKQKLERGGKQRPETGLDGWPKEEAG